EEGLPAGAVDTTRVAGRARAACVLAALRGGTGQLEPDGRAAGLGRSGPDRARAEVVDARILVGLVQLLHRGGGAADQHGRARPAHWRRAAGRPGPRPWAGPAPPPARPPHRPACPAPPGGPRRPGRPNPRTPADPPVPVTGPCTHTAGRLRGGPGAGPQAPR